MKSLAQLLDYYETKLIILSNLLSFLFSLLYSVLELVLFPK